jgi:predicted alpha/beta hydrolase
MQKIKINIQQNDHLVATLFPAATEQKLHRSVIVGPAAAVSQTYYEKFCHYLADAGFDVISFDFRGVGQSKLRDIRDYRDVGFVEWIEHDYPAVVDYMLENFPAQPLFIVGHSAGGWIPGISQISHRISGILGVGVLSAYWRLMSPRVRYLHWFAWRFLIPISVKLRGYWPGIVGLNVNMPAAFATQFGRWALNPEFVFSETSFKPLANAERFTGHLHLLQISDDPWGTPAAVQSVYQRYSKAKTRRMETIDPKQFNLKSIGHFSFFRSQHRDTLWAHLLQQLQRMSSK